MKSIYVCGRCRAELGKRDVDAGGLCPVCLTPDIRVEDAPDPEPRRGSTARVTPLEDVEDPETLPCAAPLVACLGGIQRGALLVVSGEPGEGKSTECARVAVAMDEPPAYLDAEMPAKRCRVVLRDAGATERFIRRTHRIVGEHWSDALELARGRSIWIVDSLHEWAPQEEEAELVAALLEAAEDGVIVLAIQQWTRQGRARGTLVAEHRGDLTIDVLPDAFHVRKARWGGKGRFSRPKLARRAA